MCRSRRIGVFGRAPRSQVTAGKRSGILVPMRGHRDLFPADPGLIVRMVAVGLATPLVVLAGLYGVVREAPWQIIAVVFGSLVVGAVIGMHERVAVSSRGRRLSPSE